MVEPCGERTGYSFLIVPMSGCCITMGDLWLLPEGILDGEAVDGSTEVFCRDLGEGLAAGVVSEKE